MSSTGMAKNRGRAKTAATTATRHKVTKILEERSYNKFKLSYHGIVLCWTNFRLRFPQNVRKIPPLLHSGD